MITVLIPLILLTLSALALSYLSARKFEETLPVVLLGTALTLYAFYAFDVLRIGWFAVVAALAALPLAAVYRMHKRHNVISFVKSAILTPQMAVYAVLIVFFYFLSRDKMVGIWDELRLWGSYPKALFYYGTIQLGDGSSLFAFSQSYPPLVPLLSYFMTSFAAVFSEGSLFFTRAYFGLALMLPLTRGITWKRWHGLIPITFLMVFLPYILTTNDPDYAYYYESLFVDAPAGILCGYLCWTAVRNTYKDRFSTISFAVALAAMTLTKDFGILFGGLCLMASLQWIIRVAKTDSFRKTIIRAAVAAGSLAIAYLSWQILMKIYDVTNYNTIDATIPTIQALLTSFESFAFSVVSVDLSVASASVSMGVVILLIALSYALLYIRHKDELKTDLLPLLTRVIGYGGYFFAYVMMFRDDIAGGTFPSVARYMVAMMLCESYVLLMTWTRISRSDERFLHRPFHALSSGAKWAACLLSAVVLALSVYTVGEFWKYSGGVYDDAETAAALVTESIQTQDDEIVDIWLLIGGEAYENSLLHHRVYFNLVGTGTRIKNYILPTNITQSGVAYTQDGFLAELIEDSYEYVLVLYPDDELETEFGAIFPGLVAYETDFLLYQVNNTDGVVTLTPVE